MQFIYSHLPAALAAFSLLFAPLADAEKGTPETAPYKKPLAGKIVKPKAKSKRLNDGSRQLLSKPDIPRFSAESTTGGYNLQLLDRRCDSCRVRVNITVSDSGADLSSLVFSLGSRVIETIRPAGRSYSNNNLRLNISGTRFARSGNYDLKVKATNVVGQSRTRTISLPMDIRRPSITSVTPANGATVYADLSKANITFEVTATDDVGIDNAWVEHHPRDAFWKGEDGSPPYRVTISGVDEGIHRWSVGATDHQGNFNGVLRTIHVRRRPIVRP
jgi:hypothetical protein